MKVLVVGATGGTGVELVQQALAAGHEVTALARDSSRVPERPQLRVLRGDVLVPATLTPAVVGQHAVVSAIGSGKDSPPNLRTVGTRNLISAMQEHGVRRIVSISSFGAGDSRGKGGLVYTKVIAPLFLAKVIADQTGSEEEVRRSGLDWTIVRPTRLTDGPSRGTWQVIVIGGGMRSRISRADTAAFMLQQLEDPTTIGRALGITG